MIPWKRPAGIRWRRCLRCQEPRSPKRLPERSWAATEEDYNAFIAYAKEHSLYDTGVTPQWPEQLLTLGTCEYTYEDGRLFVVGRKAGHDGP